MTITDQAPVTCRACGKPMHPWQDTSGSGWMHDTVADEYRCFRDNRVAYEEDL
jgi:hypothetical protein